MSEKVRLDIAVTERGICSSREKAKALIMAGQIYVNGQKATKAGNPVEEKDVIELRGKTLKYVSRGGLKLEKALAVFPIKLEECICMDIGASTGGFTDCMLQSGAKKVYSIDVGYGQLAWSLRTDERVVNMERTNFRYVTRQEIPDEIDFASVDVSFISLKLIFPPMFELLRQGAYAVCLIKPQFEAGRETVGKKGVVRDPAVHASVIENTVAEAVKNGFSVEGLDFSPVRGPEGNIEYLMLLHKNGEAEMSFDTDIKELVKLSHETLDGE